MNASYFILIAALLTFATGFFVASIIWCIKWLIMPKDDNVNYSRSLHLLRIFSIPDMKSFGSDSNYYKLKPIVEDLGNKELYRYNHGRN